MKSFPKPKTFQSKEYLDFIKGLSCCVCPISKEIDAHHTRAGGMGMKCSDHLTVPLCRFHHREAHQIGRNTFQEKYIIDYTDLQIGYMRQYYEK